MALRGSRRRLGACVAAFAVACLTPRAAPARESASLEGAERRWARAIARHGVDPASTPNPVAFSADMRAEAVRIAGSGNGLERLRRLQRELFDETRFPYDADSRVTLTAREAFERRTGNCVSFTNLFIALARSLGIEVRAGLITHVRQAERQGELIVINHHIVAVHEHSGGATVFDFNRQREQQRLALNLLDDADLTAVYLNNRGAEELLAGRVENAASLLDSALRLAPGFAAALANLGIVRRKLGDVEGAFAAYRAALSQVPDDATTLTNLAALYQSLGRTAEARAALRAADLRGATAWLLLIRGDLELEDGAPGRALDLYRQAARLAPKSPEMHVAIARGEITRGHPGRARRALERALTLDPTDADARRLLDDLSRGQQPD